MKERMRSAVLILLFIATIGSSFMAGYTHCQETMESCKNQYNERLNNSTD